MIRMPGISSKLFGSSGGFENWKTTRKTRKGRALARILSFIWGFLKQDGIYVGQGIIVLLGLIGTGFIGGIPRNSFNAVAVDAIILAYFISASVWRRLRPRSKFALEYARRAYRLTAWTLTVVVATVAPSVYALLPFLGKAGDLFQNIVFVIGLGVFLSLLGLTVGLADTLKQSEDEIVKKFEAGNSTRPK